MSDIGCCLTKLGLSTQNGGYATICNQSRIHFHDPSGNLIRLDTHSLKDAWDSPTRKEIDSALDHGIPHPNCQDCWDEEAAGKTSKRQLHNIELAGVDPLDSQPRAVLLKPGNTCNLGCRHCQPSVSSGWYRDAYQLESPSIDQQTWFQQFSHIKHSYQESNTGVWDTLDSWVPGIVYYDLYGGEPLLVSKLYENLVLSADNNHAANQLIHINTNGTIWHDDFNLVFSKFKSVYFDISADGTHDKFEYMRYPARWPEFSSNLEKYKLLANQFPNINLGITVTVSLYNVYYLPETIAYYESLGIHCGINILHSPDYMNMRIAPTHIKQIITEKLSDNKFDSIVKFLNLDIDDQPQLYHDFLSHHTKVDNIRNQKYKEIFPEMARYFYE